LIFDPRPKERLRDLFDREVEINKFVNALNDPAVVVLGLRRTGKSSLINAVLNDYGYRYIYVDTRVLEQKPYAAYPDLVRLLERAFNDAVGRFNELIEVFRRIRGVSVAGFSISLSWSRRNGVDIAEVFDKLNDWASDRGLRFVVVLDEAQELVKVRGANLLPVLAYVYDNLRNITIVVSGSEVRVLSRFLRLNDPESPLFGRYVARLELLPFTREQAVGFLRRGFEEVGVSFSDYDKVYDAIGGIPGWLTYFGFTYIRESPEGAIDRVREYAMSILRREFCNFLMEGRYVSKDRYIRVIEMCRFGCTWSDVKRTLEALEGRSINDATVKSIIDSLIDHSILIKRGDTYYLGDPLIADALKDNVSCT